MNLDGRIKEALERNAPDAQRRADAWSEIERAIARSHRRRLLAASLGVAAVMATAAVLTPALVSSDKPEPPIVPGPVQTAGWVGFDSKLDGFRVTHPRDWNAARDDQKDLTIVVPNDVPRESGKTLFEVDLLVNPGDYKDALIYGRKAPEFKVTEGTLKGGYPFVRVEHRVPDQNVSVRYVIDWTQPLCAPSQRCPAPKTRSVLDVTISAATSETWSRYGPTGEQIVQSIVAIPREAPSAQPTVVAKIPVAAFDVAVGEDAIWALQRSEVAGRAGKLIRIDPDTNRQVASIDVGVWPTAVLADASGVWVANGTLEGVASSYPAQNSVMRIDPRTNRIAATVRVDKPHDLATSRGSTMWVLAAGRTQNETSLVTIDLQTDKVYAQRTLEGSAEFARIAVGEGPPSDRRDVVWVTAIPASAGGPDRILLHRLDVSDTLRTFNIPASAGDGAAPVTTGFGSVWIGAGHSVVRFDVATERVVATVELPDASPISLSSVTTGEGSVWAVGGRGTLWRVDAATNKQLGDPLLIGDEPPVPAGEAAYGFSSLWVPSGDGKIWRLEP